MGGGGAHVWRAIVHPPAWPTQWAVACTQVRNARVYRRAAFTSNREQVATAHVGSYVHAGAREPNEVPRREGLGTRLEGWGNANDGRGWKHRLEGLRALTTPATHTRTSQDTCACTLCQCSTA